MTGTDIRNIFILSVDSLRYDHAQEAFGAVRERVRPVEFTNAVATASNTNSSIPALAAGVYADSKLLDGCRLPNSGGPQTLAEVLTGAGYDCALWTPNQIFGEMFNFDRGFGHGDLGRMSLKRRLALYLQKHRVEPLFQKLKWLYFNVGKRVLSALTASEETFWESAASINKTALNWIARQDEGVFCWIHYMDVHHPYEPPTEYLDEHAFDCDWTRGELANATREVVQRDGEGFSGAEMDDIQRAYRAACDYLSNQLSKFIDTLHERGQFDAKRDILVLTADHGEGFSPKKPGHLGHFSFYEEIVRVPLLISHPDWQAQTVGGQVSLIDLMPTLLELADLPVPETVDGRSATGPTDLIREAAYFVDAEDWLLTRRGIRDDSGWKLFGHYIEDERYEFVLSQYENDPTVGETVRYQTPFGEQRIPNGHREIWTRLENRLEDRLGSAVEPAKRGVDEHVEEVLEDLGYL